MFGRLLAVRFSRLALNNVQTLARTTRIQKTVVKTSFRLNSTSTGEEVSTQSSKVKKLTTWLAVSAGITVFSSFVAWFMLATGLATMMCFTEEDLSESRKEAQMIILESKENFTPINRDTLMTKLMKKYSPPAMERIKALPSIEQNEFIQRTKDGRREWITAILSDNTQVCNWYAYLMTYQLIYTPEQYVRINMSSRNDVLSKGILLTTEEIENLDVRGNM